MRFLILILFLSACADNAPSQKIEEPSISEIQEPAILSIDQIANRFDFPVGKPDAKGYYNAQKFGANLHLGEDWNAVTGGNSDLGDPVFSIANGRVDFAEDLHGGWGNVIRMTHHLPNGQKIESLYAHCDTILVQADQWVKIGDQIGTIGTANGFYLAHLHFEMRDSLMPIGGGYSDDTHGYINPTDFINTHRHIK